MHVPQPYLGMRKILRPFYTCSTSYSLKSCERTTMQAMYEHGHSYEYKNPENHGIDYHVMRLSPHINTIVPDINNSAISLTVS